MTTETMTITQALSELKILSKRIDTEISSAVFCATAKHFESQVGGKPIETAKKEMQGAYDKITALIERNNAIKAAVAKSNAETTVNIDGKIMTIAEAIYQKTTGIEYIKEFLTAISMQYENAKITVNRNNGDKLQKECEKHFEALYGSKETVANLPDIEDQKRQFLTNYAIDIIEGFNVAETIEKLKNKIDKFEAEVDSKITISNATTAITIEY